MTRKLYLESTMQIFTVGHSNHSPEKFIDLLKWHEVTAVADVRSFPVSRRCPHFSQSPLKKLLEVEGIAYVFLGEQLGARPKQTECYVEGKARYELIAQTEAFSRGLERIYQGAKRYRIALMCAEQDPIICHRTILVCKHLKNTGLDIKHILKNGDLESHNHLEERLLKLHNLSDELTLPKSSTSILKHEGQLELFDAGIFNTDNSVSVEYNARLSFEDLIDQAYQIQGEKIAYIGKYPNKGFIHERAS